MSFSAARQLLCKGNILSGVVRTETFTSIPVCSQTSWLRKRSLATQAAPGARKRQIQLEEGMTVSHLAKELRSNPGVVTRLVRKAGKLVKNATSPLPLAVSEWVVLEMGHTPQLPKGTDIFRLQHHDSASLVPRPPIVTVMGHVDHGKTTLLDSLRKTSVAAGEAGGITQHIGAFSVLLRSGHRITFLDTPGHAAFTTMRARGADVTDIVVLVIAADDGIMEQTLESLKMVQRAKVPLVVAVNKCDKHSTNISRIKQDLLQHSVQLEEFGGEVQAVEISALKGTGLEALEEAIVAQAELCSVQSDPQGLVEGTVIESKVDKGLGPVATVIVEHGSVKIGDVLVAGTSWGKVRALFDEHREPLKQAPPSTPVLVVGWKELPEAGDDCLQARSEQHAREVCTYRDQQGRRREQLRALRRHSTAATKEEEKEGGDGGDIMNIPLVVKGDVAGSVEALVELLKSRQPEAVRVSVIHSGVGPISDSDIEMAASSNGLILGFNVTQNKVTAALAKQREVKILSHNVIYKLLELLKEELGSYLRPCWEEELVGEAVLLKVFKLTGARRASVGGCRVKQGRLVRSSLFRLLRDGEVVHEGAVTGMMHGKDDVEVARKETECGVSFAKDPGFQEGDVIQCYNKKQATQTLKWDLGF